MSSAGHDLSEKARGAVLGKGEVIKLIGQNSPRFQLMPSTHLKSEVWKDFKQIAIDKKPVDFVKCNTCPLILSWKKTSGTNSLKRHAPCDFSRTLKKSKLCPDNKSIVPITQYLPKNIAKSEIDLLNEKIVAGLAKDIQPLWSVDRVGFIHIAQGLINFGARHGFQDARKVIYHAPVLKTKYLPKLVSNLKTEVKEDLRTALSYPKLSFTFTTDMWSDKYKQRNFKSLS